MAKRYLSFGFSCEEDKCDILYNSPWVMAKHTLLLQKWAANLYSLDASRIQASVWIRLTGLPLEFRVEDVFQGIFGAFGELLSMDLVTVSMRRMIYARLCVSVYQGSNMPKFILLKSKLGVWKQHIEYETIPFACFHYKKSGHWAKKCPSLNGAPKKFKKTGCKKD